MSTDDTEKLRARVAELERNLEEVRLVLHEVHYCALADHEADMSALLELLPRERRDILLAHRTARAKESA